MLGLIRFEVTMKAFAAWLEGREFYELMQAYRHAPLVPFETVRAAFDEVKAAVLKKHEEAVKSDDVS
jgi:hypothetical protein